jgi:hypothetical protein
MTMTLISTATLSSTTDITFSSIPQTFSHLYLVLSLRGGTSSEVDFGLITFNSAGDGHYTLELRKEQTQNFSANSWNNQAWGVFGSMPGNASSGDSFSAESLYIMDYSKTNVEKGWLSDSAAAYAGGSNNRSRIAGGRWNSTAAITSIRIFGSEGNLQAKSRVSLYGIKTGSGGATVS